MSGGTDPSVEMYQSPQQKQVFNWAFPTLQAGTGQQPYGLPSAQGLQPTQQWYQGMSPQVMSGIQAPYQQGFDQMMETMGSRGQTGSARGGYSGTAGAATGIYSEQAARGIGGQAWNMSYPGMQAQYRAELDRNITAYNRPFQEAQLAAGLMGGTYPTSIIHPGSESDYASWGNTIGDLIGTIVGSYYGGSMGGEVGGQAGGGVGENVGMAFDYFDR